jgi:hypothetical protein
MDRKDRQIDSHADRQKDNQLNLHSDVLDNPIGQDWNDDAVVALAIRQTISLDGGS